MDLLFHMLIPVMLAWILGIDRKKALMLAPVAIIPDSDVLFANSSSKHDNRCCGGNIAESAVVAILLLGVIVLAHREKILRIRK